MKGPGAGTIKLLSGVTWFRRGGNLRRSSTRVRLVNESRSRVFEMLPPNPIFEKNHPSVSRGRDDDIEALPESDIYVQCVQTSESTRNFALLPPPSFSNAADSTSSVC